MNYDWNRLCKETSSLLPFEMVMIEGVQNTMISILARDSDKITEKGRWDDKMIRWWDEVVVDEMVNIFLSHFCLSPFTNIYHVISYLLFDQVRGVRRDSRGSTIIQPFNLHVSWWDEIMRDGRLWDRYYDKMVDGRLMIYDFIILLINNLTTYHYLILQLTISSNTDIKEGRIINHHKTTHLSARKQSHFSS